MLLYIALGGAAGTLARYGLSGAVQRLGDGFPYGTMAVNVAGSFLLGFFALSLLSSGASTELRAGLTVGFCGGFTTFSTFSHETVLLLHDGHYGRAAWYVGGSVLLSLLATVAGLVAARAMAVVPR